MKTFPQHLQSYYNTCKLLSGSIRCTATPVDRGREHSWEILGASGVRTCNGELGVKPKLKLTRKKELYKFQAFLCPHNSYFECYIVYKRQKFTIVSCFEIVTTDIITNFLELMFDKKNYNKLSKIYPFTEFKLKISLNISTVQYLVQFFGEWFGSK